MHTRHALKTQVHLWISYGHPRCGRPDLCRHHTAAGWIAPVKLSWLEWLQSLLSLLWPYPECILNTSHPPFQTHPPPQFTSSKSTLPHPLLPIHPFPTYFPIHPPPSLFPIHPPLPLLPIHPPHPSSQSTLPTSTNLVNTSVLGGFCLAQSSVGARRCLGTGHVLRREGIVLAGIAESQDHIETVVGVVNGDATNQLVWSAKVEGKHGWMAKVWCHLH